MCGYNNESKTKRLTREGITPLHQRRDGRRHAGFILHQTAHTEHSAVATSAAFTHAAALVVVRFGPRAVFPQLSPDNGRHIRLFVRGTNACRKLCQLPRKSTGHRTAPRRRGAHSAPRAEAPPARCARNNHSSFIWILVITRPKAREEMNLLVN